MKLEQSAIEEMVCRINMDLTELHYKVEDLEDKLAQANAHICELLEKGKEDG